MCEVYIVHLYSYLRRIRPIFAAQSQNLAVHPRVFFKIRYICFLKITVCILSLAMAFLIVQPVISLNKLKGTCCSGHCCKKKENKKSSAGNKDCNPLMRCQLCSLFIVSGFTPSESSNFSISEKVFIRNDNRTVKNLSECWHPPNYTGC